MRTIWRIYRRDLLRILRNPVAVVVTLGVAIIPSLYAWFNILANWDPYSATGNLQVAVANEDRGTSNELVGKLNAGDQVVSELKDNHQLGWRFVDSEDDAISGVETGRYYAAIVLPKDFSESLVDSVTGDSAGDSTGESTGGTNSRHPQIRYYVNEKKNAIAPKITDTGATTIDEQINAAFIATVGDTVMSSISAANGALDKAGDAAQQDSIANLSTVLTTLDNVDRSLTNLSAALKAADSTIADATTTTDSLKRSIESARKASQQSGTLLAEAQQGSQAFSTTLVGALDTSSAQLSGIAVDVNTAAGTIIGSFNTAQNSVDSITNALNAPLDRTQAALDNVKDALRQAGFGENNSDPNVQQIWRQINALSSVISTQQSQVNDFHADASKFISSGKNATTGLSKAMGTAATGGLAALSQARQSLTGTVMPNLDASLNGFAALNGTLDGTLVSLNGTLDQANGLFKQLSGTISQTRSTVSGTQQSLTRLASDVRTVRTDLGALDSSAIYRNLTNTLHLNNEEFGTFMSQPVSLATKVVYPTDNYGSAVTPFYTNLALWVGGFVLIAIYKLEVDREHLRHVTATQAYLGRWLLLITVGFLQAIIACVGDLVLGIQCEHPALFLLAGIFCSFVYINIIYALAVAFRHIGKAVAVILVIVQIPGASGLYPIELMPDFFRDLHPWLPFTYGINAMRGPIAGTYANHYWLDMMHLSWYLPVALFVGLVVRRYAMNLNALFDRRLGDTDLMITEHNTMVNEQVSLTSVFGATSGSKDLRAFITRRAHRFFARYPRLITTGLVLLTVLPFVFLILLFVTRAKIAMLTAWILSIILIDAYLVVVEYIRESFARQIGVSAMTADEFRDTMLNGYVWRRARHKHANSWAGAWGNTDDTGNTGNADTADNAQSTQSGGSR